MDAVSDIKIALRGSQIEILFMCMILYHTFNDYIHDLSIIWSPNVKISLSIMVNNTNCR